MDRGEVARLAGQGMMDLIPGEWLGWIAGAVGAFVAAVAVWLSGRRSGAVRAENRGLRDYKATRERMDDVDDLGNDPAAAARWLRERGKR